MQFQILNNKKGTPPTLQPPRVMRAPIYKYLWGFELGLQIFFKGLTVDK